MLNPLPKFEELPPKPEVTAQILRPDASLAEIVAAAFTGYADRTAFVRRNTLGAFDSMTYGEAWTAIGEIASSWVAAGMVPGDMIGILGFTSPEFVLLDMAAVQVGLPVIPLPMNLAPPQLAEVLTEAAPRYVASSVSELPLAIEAIKASDISTTLVIFDIVDDETDSAQIEQTTQALPGTPVITLAQLRAQGEGRTPPAPFRSTESDPLSTIYYTSGSTGSPKGAMYTERLVKPSWTNDTPGLHVLLHYQPLSHSFGRAFIATALSRGGLSHFVTKSDLSTLLEDIAFVRPTTFPFVPRVCELLFQRFKAELERRVAAGEDPEKTRAALIVETREKALGGRLARAVTGSAPTSADLDAFMTQVLGFRMMDGYGATEVGGVTFNGKVMRPPVIDYKLIDVPELGYFTTDRPHPRGELLVKSERMIPGYFNRPELTAAMCDADGFYKTGDIMAQTGPDQLVYLDRRNNVLKLSQGEFVAIANLESVFTSGHPAIRQVFLYGNSSRAFLLAVVVPNRDFLTDLEPGATKAALLTALREVADAQQLNSYEIPRDILVEEEPFSAENGLLAGVGKYLRPKFNARYAERLEALYDSMAEQQDSELRELRLEARNLPTLEAVCRAVRATLGTQSSVVTGEASFDRLGGDSLSALSLSMLLDEALGVAIDVGTILHPAATLASLAEQIDAFRRGDGGTLPSAHVVHQGKLDVLRASDLKLDRFIDPETLEKAAKLAPAALGEPSVVLLTGANGYLGRIICLEWLERAARTGAKVVCVIRAGDNAAAHARLRESLDSGDAELLVRFDELAESHLEVLAGDLAAPRLGLDDTTWTRLAETVDVIVHPAALVNHKLPYAQLFAPNVAGTAEVIKLALTTRAKRIAFVSTIAAAGRRDGTAIREDEPIVQAIPEWVLSDGYADGYASSKWAGEVLVVEAHERFGLPCTIHRSDMILPHTRYQGQMNVPDMFVRWLISIVETGVAPVSFYRTAEDSIRPHYDGIPVDYTAKAVIELAEAKRTGFATYHLVNGHDDGVSLDTFVDWIADSGHRVERIASHAEWFERFETKLRALPEQRRQATVLPLLEAFSRPMPAIPGAHVPHDEFDAQIARLAVGAGAVPHLDKRYITKAIRDLEHLGLVTPG